MVVSVEIVLSLDGCASLKEKRGWLKPLLAGLRRRFNASAAETGLQDSHDRAGITIAMAGNERRHLQSEADTLLDWVEENWRAGELLDAQVVFL